MTYKELKHKIKEEQKALALKIRNGKTGRKPSRRNSDNYGDYDSLEWNQSQYRHRHIVYCNLFNRTPYELIEQPRDGNSPSSYQLDKIRQEWESELDEVVRDCA
jgi:hypothetical protein